MRDTRSCTSGMTSIDSNMLDALAAEALRVLRQREQTVRMIGHRHPSRRVGVQGGPHIGASGMDGGVDRHARPVDHGC